MAKVVVLYYGLSLQLAGVDLIFVLLYTKLCSVIWLLTTQHQKAPSHYFRLQLVIFHVYMYM